MNIVFQTSSWSIHSVIIAASSCRSFKFSHFLLWISSSFYINPHLHPIISHPSHSSHVLPLPSSFHSSSRLMTCTCARAERSVSVFASTFRRFNARSGGFRIESSHVRMWLGEFHHVFPTTPHFLSLLRLPSHFDPLKQEIGSEFESASMIHWLHSFPRLDNAT